MDTISEFFTFIALCMLFAWCLILQASAALYLVIAVDDADGDLTDSCSLTSPILRFGCMMLFVGYVAQARQHRCQSSTVAAVDLAKNELVAPQDVWETVDMWMWLSLFKWGWADMSDSLRIKVYTEQVCVSADAEHARSATARGEVRASVICGCSTRVRNRRRSIGSSNSVSSASPAAPVA